MEIHVPLITRYRAPGIVLIPPEPSHAGMSQTMPRTKNYTHVTSA
jgi:hypothetical protein